MMALTINTNLSSLVVQLSLKKSTLDLNHALEQMSTGYRINSAKDDAAGYAVATKMNIDLSSYRVVSDNASIGLDMVRNANSYLSIMSDSLSRLRDLSIQAQNGTYGSDSISAITREANELISELYRLKSSAEYNGKKLFSSSGDATNGGKDLKLNSQGFLEEVNIRDTSSMTKFSSVDENMTINSGTYSISTADELAKFARMVISGKITDGEFVLANDIDLSSYSSGAGWTPIGNYTNPFRGTFDGNGHTISGLYTNISGSHAGLFSHVARKNDGTYSSIKNLRIENANVKGSRAGILVGEANSTLITNCYVSGTIQGSDNAGGIIGSGGDAYTTYCYADVDVSAGLSAGGISGANNYSTSSYCYVVGTVTGISGVGGIAGWGEVSGCRSSAVVSGETDVGGITGRYNNPVSDCYFSGTVSGNSNVGGICGRVYQQPVTYSNNIVTGQVSGISNVGLMIGQAQSQATVQNNYYDSSLSAGLPLVGGGTFQESNNIDMSMGTSFYLQIGINSDKYSGLTFNTYISLPGLNDLTGDGIMRADFLDKVDSCLSAINLKQSELGAVENRLESVLDSLQVSIENTTSSLSTIKDADIAKVSSEFIRAQILQQASATLLATANQLPSVALGLL